MSKVLNPMNWAEIMKGNKMQKIEEVDEEARESVY
jgi:hypothetical protein